MRATLVNHACVLLEFEGYGLLTNSWLDGYILGNSWGLVATTPKCLKEAVRGTTPHLKISHEHPDHFYPPTLRSSYVAEAGQKPQVLMGIHLMDVTIIGC